MNVEVTKDNVIISDDSNQPHQEEYKITRCYFTFDEYIGSCENKVAVFTIMSTKESYTMDILDNECDIPNQVLKHEYDTVKLGVYGYDVETVNNEEVLKLRYSPSYTTFVVSTGSYVEGAKTPEMITPTQYELYSNKLQEGLDTLYEAVQETENLNLEAEKVGGTTTVTLTKKDGTTKEVEILDGVSLEDIEIVNRYLIVTYGGDTHDLGQVQPNVQVGSTTTIAPSMQARVEVTGDSMNPVLNFYIPKGEAGAIKTQIVQTLPQIGSDDTIYLLAYAEITVQELPSTGVKDTVYIVESTGKRYVYENGRWDEIGNDNKFAEYLWINNTWERLGGISVNIDLQDYYTKSEVDSLLGGKQDKLTAGLYITIDNNNTIDVKDVVRTNGQDYIYGNKYFDNFPTTNSQKTPDSDNQLVPKKYVDTGLSGKQNTIDSSHKLSSDLVDDSSGTNKFVTSEDKTNWNGKVGFTDYATSSVAGVIRQNTNQKFMVDVNGYPYPDVVGYSGYTSMNNYSFISKGTLENVITGKDLTTKAYVDSLVGDIETLLQTLDIGTGV